MAGEVASDPRNVLVVEDDAVLSEFVGELLIGAGYHPVSVAEHKHIAAAVTRWKPRCVILDGEIGPAGKSRTWADAAAIRREHPELPVVMFTADGAALAEAEAGTSRRSRAAGFAGTVAKPFVVEEFLATVGRAVDGPPSADIVVFPDVGLLTADWPETDLFGMVVHELRAPLTVMRGQAQLARRRIGTDPAREREAIDKAIAQMDRMATMISELLDQARLASNGLSLKVVAFDLAGAVEEAVARHEFEDTRHISLRRPAHSVRVHGDPARIAQILDNLLGNAIKYSPGGELIRISLTTRGQEACVRVADHGVGIPDDERVLLFTPFFRSSRTRDVRGTGLGLHISKRLAERHGGRLSLERSSDAGSVFALSLPIMAD